MQEYAAGKQPIATITLVGLGPGDPALLTRAAWSLLEQLSLCYTPVPNHPALAHLPPEHVVSLSLTDLRACRELLLNRARALAASPAAVDTQRMLVCALPGHPHDSPLTADLLDYPDPAVQIAIIAGVSLVDACCDALALGGRVDGLQVLDAALLVRRERAIAESTEPAAQSKRDSKPVQGWSQQQGIGSYTPPLIPYPFLPTNPVLLLHPSHLSLLPSRLQETLLLRYPPMHPLKLVCLDQRGAGAALQDVTAATLSDVLNESNEREWTALYLAPLSASDDRRSFETLAWVAMRLLGPGGCPWDCKQTHQSLRTGLLEETYEVLEALDTGDMGALSEELGDLALQVVIHSEMARQAGHFTIGDVLDHISTKLIRRHPHVFSDLAVADVDEVLRNWEQIKAEELREKGRQRTSALDGVPPHLPGLAAAQKMMEKALKAGFARTAIQERWDKLHEELNELVEASSRHEQHASPASYAHLAEELGDLLLAVATLGWLLNVDAEIALREALAKFRRRFTFVEQAAAEQGHRVHDLSNDEIDVLWAAAKRATD